MGSEKQSTQSSGSTTYTPTEEERAMQALQLQQMEQVMPQQTQAQLAGLALVNQLLTGTEPLPGFFNQMSQGISPEAIANQATIFGTQALPGFQSLGLAESGSAARAISQDIANNILFPAEQFNIGVKQNLLNQALTGQAQVQSPITASQGIFSSQLQGLRSVNTNATSMTTSMNPFMKSFQTSLGSGLASGLLGGVGGVFGGASGASSQGMRAGLGGIT